MKARRKLVISIALLLLSFTLATTSGFAWFSANREVKADGMILGSTAPENLLISTNLIDWANTVQVTNVSALNGFKMYPASTSDGHTFFAITNTGNVINGDQGGTRNDNDIGEIKFQTETLTPVSASADGYYTSYTLYIKTQGSEDAYIYLSALDAKSGRGAGVPDIDDCMRIAIFKDSVADANLVGIYDADTQDIVHPIASVSAEGIATLYKKNPGDAEASDPKTVVGTQGNAGDNVRIKVPGGGTEYVTLVVNVWIEGQNTNCKNVIAGDAFRIDLMFNAID